ncbi:CUB and sushi domain-containing protein 1-like [Pocillopora damicornis]|uniref:CUB and sushi domain-containing protein 1-like n=1 Tax=Pocillopora damicornis TaxID=46731 RepID=UPI000F557E90|nr:CUB and sushi domain-containing protein 1-like [Pocillopora damicornis]
MKQKNKMLVLACITVTQSLPFPSPTTRPPPKPVAPGQCGGALVGPSGNLASPNYPGNYPSNAYCVWTVTVPPGSQFRIDFLFFETEPCYDLVKVYQGRRLIRRLTRGGESEDDKYFKDKNDDNDDDECDDDDDDDDDDYDDDNDKNGKRNYMFAEPLRADRKAKVVSVHGNGEPVRIVFKSDPWVTRRGFFAHYTMGKALCGGPLAPASGNITSPGFPANYPNDVECRWTIRVPLGSTLVLNFRAFETERCFDHVKILRGFREIRSLSGIYGAYSWFTGRHDDFLDDDCEDDDDDDDDGDDDDDEDWKKKFRFGFGMTRFYGFPFLPRVYILGNGEQISVNFKSDKIITFKGFDATYRVVRGPVEGK